MCRNILLRGKRKESVTGVEMVAEAEHIGERNDYVRS
jgi:hypothetical protein